MTRDGWLGSRGGGPMRWSLMDERWSRGWRNYVQPRGDLEGRGMSRVWRCHPACPCPGPPKPPLHPRRRAPLPTHRSSPCSRHTSCILLHQLLWANPGPALRGGASANPTPGLPTPATALPTPSGRPLPRPLFGCPNLGSPTPSRGHSQT